MRMPSLFKYFAFVGTALLALLTFINFVLDPSTGATPIATKPKTVIAVQHDPRASKIERWRDEQAALKAAEQRPTADNASLAVKSTPVPFRPASFTPATPAPQASQPAAQSEPAQAPTAEILQTANAAAVQTEPDAVTRVAELARIKAKKAEKAKFAAKARKARLAHERVKTEQQQAIDTSNQFYGGIRQRDASNQQDQYYYGQRVGAAQGAPAQSPAYAYAPRPAFGPFGRGW